MPPLLLHPACRVMNPVRFPYLPMSDILHVKRERGGGWHGVYRDLVYVEKNLDRKSVV